MEPKATPSGKVAVGHPVDVASGTLFHDFQDWSAPGRMSLTFARHYSTALLDSRDGLFGQGWSSPFEMRIRCNLDGLALVGEDGEAAIPFAADSNWLESGATVRNLGAFFELRHDRQLGIVATRWSATNSDVTRFIFQPTKDRKSWLLASRQTPWGDGIDVLRDAQGRIEFLRQRREQRALRLTRNAAGRVIECHLRTPAGRERSVLRYTYDRDGRLAGCTDAAGNQCAYTYDATGRMTWETNVGGMIYSFRFDARGRCVQTRGDGDFGLTSLEFEDAARVTRVSDALGNVTTFLCNANGQVEKTVSPNGWISSTVFDDWGRIVKTVAATGATTVNEFDEAGNLVQVTHPTGATTRHAYNDQHQRILTIDPAGNEWRRSYDSAGRVRTVSLPTGEASHLDYDERGDLSALRDPAGNARRFTYDEFGNRTRQIDRIGRVNRYEYDDEGQLRVLTDALGERLEFSYDVLGRINVIRLPDGSRRRITRNVYGQVTEDGGDGGVQTRWRYSGCGQLTEINHVTGAQVRFEWTLIPGQMSAVINETGERQTFEYDAEGRLARVVDFAGRPTQYEYDGAGQTVAIVDAAGQRTQFKRNPGGAVAEIVYPDLASTRFEYDPRGALLKADNGDCPIEYALDALGRVVREKQGEHEIHSSYDVLGRRTQRSTSLGYRSQFEWNANGKLTRLVWDEYRGIQFDYDPAQNEIVRHLVGGPRVAQTFDWRNRRVAQHVTATGGVPSDWVGGGSTALPRRRYRYDGRSNLQEVIDEGHGTTRYEYDGAGHVSVAQHSGGLTERFAYDRRNNLINLESWHESNTVGKSDRTALPWNYAPGSRLVERAGCRYEYNVVGQLVAKGDVRGTTRYEWNGAGDLARVTLPDGAQWEYRYDALGRRVGKRGAGREFEFVWDRDRVVHEVRHNGDGAAHVAHWEFDPAGFAPLAKVENGAPHLCVNDVNGAPHELVSADSTVSWAADFTTFGERRRTRVSKVDCPVRFQGQWHDEETGLHYNRHRYYDPAIGRFISPDPVGLLGGLNAYSYAPNPLTWIDPYGLTQLCGTLPPGSVIHEDKSPDYIIYEVNGQKFIRFKADVAVTLQQATPGRNNTVDAEATLNDQGVPYVLEGRHRAIGVARYGDTVEEANGGVPGLPGYLNYPYTEPHEVNMTGGVPVKNLTIDRQPELSRQDAINAWNQQWGNGGTGGGTNAPDSNAPTNPTGAPTNPGGWGGPTNQTGPPPSSGSSGAPTNPGWGAPTDPSGPPSGMNNP